MEIQFWVTVAVLALAGWLVATGLAAIRRRRQASMKRIDGSHRVNPATVVGNWYGRGERRDPWS